MSKHEKNERRNPRRSRRRKAFSLSDEMDRLRDNDPEKATDAEDRLMRVRVLMAEAASMDVRHDSRLAWLYATEQGHGEGMSAEEAALDMIAIQYIYEHTGYGALVQNNLRAIADWCKEQYPTVSWSQVWEIVTDTCVGACKIEAMLRVGDAGKQAMLDQFRIDRPE